MSAPGSALSGTSTFTVTGVDEIDLLTLGHMPGGARRAHASPPQDIDVTGLGLRAAQVRVLAQSAILVPGEHITITADYDPAAILDVIHHDVPGFSMIEYRASGPQQWRVTVTRVSC
ncbi:DUF2249 domain-containing protein [Demequina sediminicola]|uniref:DUF2249 domain-containing protein n=1 Tax=Demequina sediminicola TaxID=1095026 RepID=UPI0013791EDF|nr:DUF2249 domain-containing protein [Demequina sediminicola]